MRHSSRPRSRRLTLLVRALAALAILIGLTSNAAEAASPSGSASQPTPSTTPPATAPAQSSAGSASSTPPPAGAPNHGKGQATFGIGPASAKGLDGRPYLRYFTSPGAQALDHIAVENFNVQPVTVSLYSADAINGPDGSLGYLARSARSTGAATWLSVRTPTGSPTITLRPRSLTVLPLILRVPSSATPGDHAAGVFVSLTSKVKGASGQNLNFEQRIALRTFVRVSGPLHPSLQVQQLRASFDGELKPLERGTVTMTYNVRNTGNVELGARQAVTVQGLFGRTGQRVQLPNISLLLPGGSQLITVKVPRVLASFAMTSTVSLVPMALVGDADPKVGDIHASTSFVAVPWIAVGVLVLLVLLPTALFLRRRHRRRRPNAPPPPSAPTRPVFAERT